MRLYHFPCTFLGTSFGCNKYHDISRIKLNICSSVKDSTYFLSFPQGKESFKLNLSPGL